MKKWPGEVDWMLLPVVLGVVLVYATVFAVAQFDTAPGPDTGTDGPPVAPTPDCPVVAMDVRFSDRCCGCHWIYLVDSCGQLERWFWNDDTKTWTWEAVE